MLRAENPLARFKRDKRNGTGGGPIPITFLMSILIAASSLCIQGPCLRALILMANFEDVSREGYHYWR